MEEHGEPRSVDGREELMSKEMGRRAERNERTQSFRYEANRLITPDLKSAPFSLKVFPNRGLSGIVIQPSSTSLCRTR